MKQYLDLAQKILDTGTYKSAARENMPGTYSRFGEQLRFDLSEGFPMITTKKISFKNIVTELIWFLKGDTNIKFLVDNGCNIWNEDAYNYYIKICDQQNMTRRLSYEDFVRNINDRDIETIKLECARNSIQGQAVRLIPRDYILGDCGKQYGWLWRNWESGCNDGMGNYYPLGKNNCGYVDQIQELIDGLKYNPMSRRHIISAWNPATLDDMALNACHSFVQFNCRPISYIERWEIISDKDQFDYEAEEDRDFALEEMNIPKYYLDCQMYQRSGDFFLGVPFNIASYSLLIHIICKLTNMIPGDFVHTFGDVHIYENHIEQVKEQLTRTPDKLPTLYWNTEAAFDHSLVDLDDFLNGFEFEDLGLTNYSPQPAIKGKLSTGLK